MKKCLKNNLFIILGVIFTYTACDVSVDSNKVYQNENIPYEIIKEISPLDKKVLNAIENNDPNLITDILSTRLIEQVGYKKIDSNITAAFNLLSGKEVIYKGQIYVKNNMRNVFNNIISGTGDEKYGIHFQALNKESFISLLIPQDVENEILITLIYDKFDDDWKLNNIQFGIIRIFYKNAIDYCKMAQRQYDNGYLIDATNSMYLAQQCAKPAGGIFQYILEPQIINLQVEIIDKIHSIYSFPLTIENIETKPRIFNIHPHRTIEGYYPTVRYLTNIDLDDVDRLEHENNLIQNQIGSIFKGIDIENRHIFYRAFNKIPVGSDVVRHYGFIQTIE